MGRATGGEATVSGTELLFWTFCNTLGITYLSINCLLMVPE